MGLDKWNLSTINEISEPKNHRSVVQVEHIYHSDEKVTVQVTSPALHRLPVWASFSGHPYTMNMSV